MPCATDSEGRSRSGTMNFLRNNDHFSCVRSTNIDKDDFKGNRIVT